MKTFSDLWFDDVKGRWIVDTELKDGFVHCYYILDYKIDEDSWMSSTLERYFKYVEVLFKNEDIMNVDLYSNTEFGFNQISQCVTVSNTEKLEKLNSNKEVAKVLLGD